MAKRARYDIQGALPKLGFASLNKSVLFASYKVAHEVTKMKKLHTVVETLIKPFALKVAKTSNVQKMQCDFSVRQYVILSRIDDIGADILDQVVSDIKTSSVKISVQLDETTDVSNCGQFMFYSLSKGNCH